MIGRIIVLLLIIGSILLCIEVDPNVLEEIVKKNAQAYSERILLAKFYEKNNKDNAALSLLADVLKAHKDDVNALQLKEKIEKKLDTVALFKKANLSIPINAFVAEKNMESYYTKGEYEFYRKLYEALLLRDIKLSDKIHTNVAYIYLWDEKYELSMEALARVKNKKHVEYIKIKADICYFTEDYHCAEKLYSTLYSSSGDINDAIKLIYSLMYLGQMQEARNLYEHISIKYPDHIELSDINEKLVSIQTTYLNKKKKIYEEKKDLKSLEVYANALYSAGQDKEAVALIHLFNKTSATEKSLLLEARYLAWMGESRKSLHILHQPVLKDNLMAELMMGKIYSWLSKYEESKKYLTNVIGETLNQDLIYDAKRALAFVFMWEKDNKSAKGLFKQLHKENKSDEEVIEALMALNKEYKKLIKIYKRKVEASGSADNIKRLSEYYVLDGQLAEAIKLLKRYLKVNPNNMEITKHLALLLIENKEYEIGFEYLEYYAKEENDSQSKLLLAQYYNWHGFRKKSLSVLDALLKIDPKNKNASLLKESIEKPKQVEIASNVDQNISVDMNISKTTQVVVSSSSTVASKQLELADKLYFASHYKASLMYYENYIQTVPSDNDARGRYAFALEHAQDYAKAEGEFYLLTLTESSNIYTYHFAHNMMMNGKLDKAKKVFKTLQHSLYEVAPQKLKKFIRSWENTRKLKNFSAYMTHYDMIYQEDDVWMREKKNEFENVDFSVESLDDIISKKVNKNHYIVKVYHKRNGSNGIKNGYRTFYLQCNTNMNGCEITRESWREGEKEEFVPLMPYVEQGFKDIEFYKNKKLNPKQIYSKKSISAPTSVKKRSTRKQSRRKQGIRKQRVPKLKIIPQTKKSSEYVYAELVDLKAKAESKNRTKHFNALSSKGFQFEDSEKNAFSSIDLAYKRFKLTDSIDVGMDVGAFSIEQLDVEKFNGFRYGVSLFYDNFQFRLGANQYEDFFEWAPTVKYNNKYKNHSYELEYTRQNALFYTYNTNAYKKRIVADHFSVSDYAYFDTEVDLWTNILVNSFSNGDTELTAQFDWRFFYHQLRDMSFSYNLALEGWYTSHSLQHNDFYSPGFVDSTLIRFDPRYKFSDYVTIRGLMGVGYSSVDETTPYKLGVWIYGDNKDNLSYKAGCLQSNTVRKSNNEGYSYSQCELGMEYKW